LKSIIEAKVSQIQISGILFLQIVSRFISVVEIEKPYLGWIIRVCLKYPLPTFMISMVTLNIHSLSSFIIIYYHVRWLRLWGVWRI
jgi:hypothetical protein